MKQNLLGMRFLSNKNFYLFLSVGKMLQVDPVTDPVEKRVIDWKFDQLDKNNDGSLNRREFRVLRRLVRKVVRPKRCTRNFPRLCDSDQDRRISRSEWSVCLGVGINSKYSSLLAGQESFPSKCRNEPFILSFL
jgi:Secreted protein acidic and rich in cysteine Ca binding region